MALDFVIVGAQRAGTTWTFLRLSMHPQIYFPLGKEINFWNRYFDLAQTNPKMNGLYYGRFESKAIAKDDDLVLGDVSPNYAVMDKSCIDKLYERYPKAKAIYILRNPVLRTYSARRFSVTRGKIPAAGLSEANIEKLFEIPEARLHSDYADHIERWNEVARNRNATPLEIVYYEDLLRDPVKFIKQIASLIGIDGGFYDYLPAKIVGKPVNVAVHRELPGKLYPRILDLYRPMVTRLQALMQRDFSGWLDPHSPSEFSSPETPRISSL
jgi:hypothetical protein